MERNDDGVSSPAEASLFGGNRPTCTATELPALRQPLAGGRAVAFQFDRPYRQFLGLCCGAQFATSIEVKRRAVA